MSTLIPSLSMAAFNSFMAVCISASLASVIISVNDGALSIVIFFCLNIVMRDCTAERTLGAASIFWKKGEF